MTNLCKTKTVVIEDRTTGQTIKFNSAQEAAEFLDMTVGTFSARFKRGLSMANATYRLISVGDEIVEPSIAENIPVDKRKIRHHAAPIRIRNKETGEVLEFFSCKDASRALDVTPPTISNFCAGVGTARKLRGYELV